MPLTSAYWPVPFTSVVQSVFMMVPLVCIMETRAENQDWVCASNSSVSLPQPRQQLGGRELHDARSLRPHHKAARGTRSNLSIELMSQQEIDEYLAKLDEPKRATLQQLRETIRSIVPGAEEGMSYGIPAYRLQGKVVAGFAAFKNHLSYLPHSGSVFAEIPDEVRGYVTSKGALQFPIDRTLPEPLVKKLIAIRVKQVRQSS